MCLSVCVFSMHMIIPQNECPIKPWEILLLISKKTLSYLENFSLVLKKKSASHCMDLKTQSVLVFLGGTVGWQVMTRAIEENEETVQED